MAPTPVTIEHPDGSELSAGAHRPLLLIAGPCVLESEEIGRRVAGTMQDLCARYGFSYIFKASYDKANRTSIASYRGPGLETGLRALSRIREEMRVPVLSDIHEPQQAAVAAEVLDVIQIPAFLCRQTDLLQAAALTGKPICVKKGQFVSPWDMEHVVKKIRDSGNSRVMLIERGTSFGYNNLVVDMRSFPVLRSFDCPVVFDATHSVQLPGGAGDSSGGQREFIAPLARAAVAAGIDGLFMEVHPEPEKARCDGPNSIALGEVAVILESLGRIRSSLSPDG